MKTITEREALIQLSALCARGEHCTFEMQEKMRRWQLPDDQQARVIERLVRDRYVDDERFAHAFVRDKIRYNKWGRRKVEQALWQKHIDEEIRRRVLDAVSDEEYLHVLRPLLQQKRRGLKAGSDYELNMKLIRFAMSRGFTMDIIRQCLDVEDEDQYLEATD